VCFVNTCKKDARKKSNNANSSSEFRIDFTTPDNKQADQNSILKPVDEVVCSKEYNVKFKAGDRKIRNGRYDKDQAKPGPEHYFQKARIV